MLRRSEGLLPLVVMLGVVFMRSSLSAAHLEDMGDFSSDHPLSSADGESQPLDGVSKRASSGFVRIGRNGNFVRFGRQGSFVRFGRTAPGADAQDTDNKDFDEDLPEFIQQRRRRQLMNRFIRIGKSTEAPHPSSLLDLISSNKLMYEPIKRSSFIRIGKNGVSGLPLNNEDASSLKSATDFGHFGIGDSLPFPENYLADEKGDDNEYNDESDDSSIDEKRASNFLRIGRSASNVDTKNIDDKRMQSFVRIGKRNNGSVRIGRSAPNFVRIGKAGSGFVRIGKSPGGFVRIGKSPSGFVRIGKTPSGFVRIGKSPSGFVRIGKSPSGFVRIGKTPSGFVRIGKSPSGFVRIGKSPSGFVRIGKSQQLSGKYTYDDKNGMGAFSDEPVDDNLIDDKRSSGFVRIGKALDTTDENEPTTHSIDIDSDKNKEKNSGDPSLERPYFSDSYDRIRTTPLINKPNDPITNSKRSSAPTSYTDDVISSLEDTGALLGRDTPKATPRRRSPHAFVRIGKIPSTAFVRIAKGRVFQVPMRGDRRYATNRKYVRRGQSSFVRIG